ncbi:DUF2125 domain-containing protein [Rubellimicrobium sp. CFH 75288]|uniref:DUF2125 domain-containing protein n=1 Tax=Rubellimicrobium sp. CFH 75288 TaxID=2697034 RepID=UPI00141366CF|nr:DUF2125 domain-containing protein [Rubellimicrobium sp. CFH 75288]NAZ36004.1 DUF2125 domain-containing protein [Rubellimicrobium sp. CFH 75288]
MRVLVGLVVAAALLYGGYWFVGQSQVENRTEAALENLAAAGWHVRYGTVNTTGFPSRFDTTITDLHLAPPDGRWAWAAPFVQALALSYRPNRIIAAFPPEQEIVVGQERMTLRTDRLRASGGVGLTPDLPLDQVVIESGPWDVVGSSGWRVAAERLLAALRPSAAGPRHYDLYLETGPLTLPAPAPPLSAVRLDGVVELDRPLDRRIGGAPDLVALAISEARLQAGEGALTLRGDLAPDEAGFLAGVLTVAAEDWRALLTAAEQAGLLGVAAREPFERGLEAAAQGSDTIEIPVTLANGVVSALGFPLAAAPRLR